MERHLQEEFRSLREKLFRMGVIVEGAIAKAKEALLKRSAILAEQIFDDEKLINQTEIEIDEKGHALFALTQPVAGDLRLLAMILKINTDLERMGDHAVNIAQRAQELAAEPPLPMDFPLEAMTDAVQRMVRNAIDCFMNENVELARRVLTSDDEIDSYNDTLYSLMMDLMQRDAASVNRAMHFVMIGHNLERIADLANNIAEDTIYYKQGTEVRHHFKAT